MFFKQAVRGDTECDVTASQVGGKKRERARESLPDFFLYLMMIVGIVGRRHFVYLSASVAEYRSWIDHEGRLLQARSKEIYRDIWDNMMLISWISQSMTYTPLFKFESCIHPSLKSPWWIQKWSAPWTGFAVRFAKVSIVAKYSSRDMKTST